MIENKFLKIEKKNSNLLLLFFSIILIIFYKIYKFSIIQDFLGFSPNDNYYEYQVLCNVYRVFATIVGGVVVFKFYRSPKSQMSLRNKKHNLILLSHLILFFLTKVLFFNFSLLDKNGFGYELFFNIFTGSWEELIFKGMFLVSFYKLTDKKNLSIILGAVVFSSWHFDVVLSHLAFVQIFTWACFSSVCFFNGSSLLSLSIYHFLWDQINFGFQWEGDFYSSTFVSILVIIDIIFLAFVANLHKKSLVKNHI